MVGASRQPSEGTGRLPAPAEGAATWTSGTEYGDQSVGWPPIQDAAVSGSTAIVRPTNGVGHSGCHWMTPVLESTPITVVGPSDASLPVSLNWPPTRSRSSASASEVTCGEVGAALIGEAKDGSGASADVSDTTPGAPRPRTNEKSPTTTTPADETAAARAQALSGFVATSGCQSIAGPSGRATAVRPSRRYRSPPGATYASVGTVCAPPPGAVVTPPTPEASMPEPVAS